MTMKRPQIPFFKIFSDNDDVQSVAKVIRRGTYWATGPEIMDFEKKVANLVGTKYAVAFNSGTSALHAILVAYGIGKGDEVIVPSFSFISTANAPLFVGAKPVFADIEEHTYGLDVEDVKRRITKKTKVIIPVHYAGCPCRDIGALSALARKKGILLIEDAAEALGTSIRNKMVGTFGDAAMFSFCQNKVITMGEGGIITTNDKKIYDKLKLFVSHGRVEGSNYFTSEDYDYVDLGYNMRMPTILASLGLSQIKKIDRVIKERKRVAKRYLKNLEGLSGSLGLPVAPKGYDHIYQMFTIRVVDGQKRRDALMDFLKKNGVPNKIYFKPIHKTKYYSRIVPGIKLPMTERLSKEVLSIPIFPDLSNKDIDHISVTIGEFFKRYGHGRKK
jgi:perosamine synthetase